MVLDGIRASKLLLKGTLEMFGGTDISHLLCRNVIFRHGCVAGHDPCLVQDGVTSLTDSFRRPLDDVVAHISHSSPVRATNVKAASWRERHRVLWDVGARTLGAG